VFALKIVLEKNSVKKALETIFSKYSSFPKKNPIPKFSLNPVK